MTKKSIAKWFLLEKDYDNMGVVVALWKKITNKKQNSNETSNGTCCNFSLGFATKVRVCKSVGQD